MKIQHKRSAALDGSVAKEPTAAQTDLGELCVNFNTADPALFIRDNADNIRRVGGDLSLYQKIEDTPPPVFVCLPNEINSQSPPAERLEGTLWWNTEEGILYVWFEDGDSEQWVIAVPQTDVDVPPGTVIGETPPSDPEVGQLWWNSSDDSGRLYVYYEDANSQQWVEASPQVDSLTEEQLDNRYLSKVSDDTAEGAITFEKLTTHEGGVSVTGSNANAAVGQGFIYDNANTRLITVSGGSRVAAVDDKGQFTFGGQTALAGCRIALRGELPENAGGNSTFIRAQSAFNATSSDIYGFYVRTSPSAAGFTGDVAAFRSDAEVTNWDTANSYKAFEAAETNGYCNENYGFYSRLSGQKAGATAYNFYAEGSAPNYFNGLTEHEGGVKVTGGTFDNVQEGIVSTISDGNTRNFLIAGGGSSYIGCDSRGYSGVNYLNTICTFNVQTTQDQYIGVRYIYEGTVDVDKTEQYGYYANIPRVNTENTVDKVSGYFTGLAASRKSGTTTIGYESNVDNSSVTGQSNYNFYAEGSAPNYFAGNTYIGGTTSRNTRELWESTLTEEQKEQLSAGTFAIPANVSLPGDGSFVRQWWHDQQSAEDQALIDSGELEYPSHFQAANFTDTFALGDKTNISLLANGKGEFAGGNLDIWRNIGRTQGIQIQSEGTNIIKSVSDDSNKKDFYISSDKTLVVDAEDEALFRTKVRIASDDGLSVNSTGSDSLVIFAPVDRAKQSNNIGLLNQWTGTVGMYSQLVHQYTTDQKLTFFKTDIISNATPTLPNNAEVIGYEASFGLTQSGITAGTNTTAYGFYSDVKPAGNGGTAYNFYAAGNAPNYFKGTIRGNGAVNLSGGLIDRDAVAGTDVSAIINGAGRGYFTAAAGTCLYIYRTDDVGGSIQKYFLGGTEQGQISITAAGCQFEDLSDYRLKTDIVDLDGATAINAVKALQPKTYTKNGVPNVIGFVAHELQEVAPLAVSGVKDGTEAIGTLADYDGTVLETEVTEPSAEELTYTEEVETDGVATMVARTRSWTPSGTRPVYQGVDQTKLIPLLTKALQEALDRIEQLESNTLQPLYASLADLPSASDHHGKVAHVHSEGALYFAHAGNWVKLQNA